MKSLNRPLAALTILGGVGGAAGLVAQNTNRSAGEVTPSAAQENTGWFADEAPETVIPDYTFADAHEVIDITNAEGETSRIAILYVEKVKSLAKKTITDDNKKSIAAGVAKSLEGKRFPSEVAKSIGNGFVSDYKAESAQKKFNARFPIGQDENMSPSALPMADTGRPLMWGETHHKDHPWTNGKVAPYCRVNDLTRTFNGADWIKGFIWLHGSVERMALKENYGKEFSEFVRDHELAHCMGADEARADYIAAKLLLRDHKDKQKAVRFLELLAKARIIHTIWTKKDQGYDVCDLTIAKAIQESRSDKKNMTDSQIWSAAKNTNLVDASLNYWAASLISKSDESQVEQWAENKEFAYMAGSFKIAAYDMPNAKSAKYKVAMKYANAFDTFSTIFKAREDAIQDERDEQMVKQVEKETGLKFPRQSPR